MSNRYLNSRREGFALPMAILAIGFMSAALVAAFSRLGSETRTVDSGRAELLAFALAQAGLEAKMAANDTTDSTRYNFPDGRADVRAIRMRSALTNADTSIWLIKSTGITRGVNAVQARRTTAQLVYRLAANIQVASAWTSLTGLTKNGGSGALAGADNCGVKGPLAGISVPTGGYVQDGGTSVPSGTPDIKGNGTQEQMKDSVKIDWNAIVNQGAITPDIVIPPGTWPNFAANPNSWPIIYIDHGPTGEIDIPEGRGMLIIEGNATMGGSRNWDGIILVGGALRSDGNNTVLGATITGLNVKLGLSVPVSDVGNGTKTFQYDSCNVDNALKGLGKLNPFKNAWLDNYSAWE